MKNRGEMDSGMALTAYCKKCNREVDPGEICPICGTKLAKNAVHAAWVAERTPVKDWMCWNAVMRWLLPAGLVVLLLALLLEGMAGGLEAVERLFKGGFPTTLGILLGATVLCVFLALLLQGKELMDYVVDSRGVHMTRYLPEPTALKLMARLKSPGRMKRMNPEEENGVLRLEEVDLPWRAVSRVQLWPEKCCILFYAPSWWLRIPLQCTPYSWEDALSFVREKLGRKKTVELPEHLRTQPEKQPSARKMATAQESALRAPAAPAPEGEEDLPWETEADESAVPPEAGEQMMLDL